MLVTRLRDRGWSLSARHVQRAYAKTGCPGPESDQKGENTQSTSNNSSQPLSELHQKQKQRSNEAWAQLHGMQAQVKVLERDLGFSASVITDWTLWQLSDDLREVIVNKVYGPSRKRAFTWTAYNKWLNNPKYSDKQQLHFAKKLMSPLCDPCDMKRMTWGLIRHTGKYNPYPTSPSAKDMAFAVWNTQTGKHIVSYEEALVILKVLEQEKALEIVLKGDLASISPIPI